MVLTFNKRNDQQELGVLLVSMPQFLMDTDRQPHVGTVDWNIKVPCFCSKCFTHCAISPAQKEFLKRMNKFETEGSLCHCQLPRRYISELVISMKWRPSHQGPRHHSSTSQNKATISQPVVSTRWRPSRQEPRHHSSYILISKVSWCICYVRTWRGEEG